MKKRFLIIVIFIFSMQFLFAYGINLNITKIETSPNQTHLKRIQYNIDNEIDSFPIIVAFSKNENTLQEGLDQCFQLVNL